MKTQHFKLVLSFLLLLAAIISNAQEYCMTSAFGYATGTTGGGSATPQLVNTYSALKSALTASGSAVIIIDGTITIPNSGRISAVISNKTVLGLPGAKLVSADQTASGSGILTLENGSNNVIIRNITFEGPGAYDADGNDLIANIGCTKLWVDHCDFQDGMDGNFDNTKMADNVTITWCRFRYLKPPKPDGPGGADDHRFTCLVSGSDTDVNSDGRYSISWQYCWFDHGCKQRMVRARNAQLHMLNCYWNSDVADYYIGLGDGVNGTVCYVENGVFENDANVSSLSYGGSPDCTFHNCIGDDGGGGATVSAPTYSYNALAVNLVKTTITNATCGAGATLLVSPTGEISSPCDIHTLVVTEGITDQTILEGEAITNTIFHWGGAATDVIITGLPAGITSTIDDTNKTLTLSGNPTESGNYTISTTGTSGTPVTVSGSITVEIPIVCMELIKIPITNLSVAGNYVLKLFDATGNIEIKTLVSGYLKAGNSDFILPVNAIVSGNYQYKLMQGSTIIKSGLINIP